MAWTVQYPVDFTPDGDRTNMALSKHISEIDRLYSLLQLLRNNFFAANSPASPEVGQLYVSPNTFELKVWNGTAWASPKAFPLAHDLDAHNAGLMADLQALVSDATILYMLVAPAAADNGKVLAVDSRGKIVLFTPPTELAPTVHGPDKHSAGTLAQARALVSDGWLAALAQAPEAADTGKVLKVEAEGGLAVGALPVMTGASSNDGGVLGMVPAPAAGDQGRCLLGDGTWGRDTKVAEAIECGLLGNAKNLTDPVNADEIVDQGIYYITTSLSTHQNLPYQDASGISVSGWLIVLRGANATMIRQLYITVHSTTLAVYARIRTGADNWGGWLRLQQENKPCDFIGTSGSNLNDYVKSGVYGFLTTALPGGSNFPSATVGVVEVYGNNAGQLYQRYTDYSGRVYVRRGAVGGSFTGWIRISPPYAQLTEGVGQFVKINIADGSACVLPDGGTWEYSVYAFDASGARVGFEAGVAAGGTQIFAADGTKTYQGTAKRVM